MPNPKRLPRAVREQQMLDAAVKVFSRRGFHAASMDEIADEAGISKPMVYAYLGSKEELFTACLHREGTRLMEAIVGAVVPDLPFDERLWRGLRAFFRFVGAHRDGWAVLYRQARGERPFAGELAAMRSRIIEVVAGMLDRGLAAQGHEVRAAERDVMAYALVGASESAADWLADHPDADPDRMATRMMNFAWTGAGSLLAGQLWRPPPVGDRVVPPPR
ncbi:TetR/AcrR family transcriptional regulator [Plantactinospora sp. S1510]|uniref:TetR/AcrR family transcriptional regulator n=1 Tax=Plantactinospora alkalitolerans TaxID=2789879 RepID=A0ABS0GYN6_9ACTN|nr:TetR/AcrR family transcriptional regulator [Plantactinospora alkalitolerans]MBF9131330.1 TetR/AcrR family transcriptional regulator [Plantactinospora alkalitolerans]